MVKKYCLFGSKDQFMVGVLVRKRFERRPVWSTAQCVNVSLENVDDEGGGVAVNVKNRKF